MPRDTNKPVSADPHRPLLTLADLLTEDEADEAAAVPVIEKLTPLSIDQPIPRLARSAAVPDLSALARAWLLIGEGGNGKTTFARYVADQIGIKGLTAVLATIAPGNRALNRFAEGVMAPQTTNPLQVAEWQLKLLQGMARKRFGGTLDSGGGDISTGQMIKDNPALVSDLEEQGLALIAGYFFSPRVDDIAYLDSYEAMGFRPRATALILNLARADTPSAFDDIRRQPAYKAALDRGAVELWLPALPQKTALVIERNGLRFSNARSALKLFERSELDRWLDAMQREFLTVETWLPWT